MNPATTTERERLTQKARVANAALLEQASNVKAIQRDLKANSRELEAAELIMEQLKAYAEQCAQEAEDFNAKQPPA